MIRKSKTGVRVEFETKTHERLLDVSTLIDVLVEGVVGDVHTLLGDHDSDNMGIITPIRASKTNKLREKRLPRAMKHMETNERELE